MSKSQMVNDLVTLADNLAELLVTHHRATLKIIDEQELSGILESLADWIGEIEK